MAMSTQDKRDRQLDAERAVIGSMLIDPSIVRNVLARINDADFLNSANRLIFQAARALLRAGEPVDPITIRGRIGDQYTDYMAQLMEITPTSANWEAYAAQMHDEATVRRIRDLADKLSLAVNLDECRPLCANLGQLLSVGAKTDAWTMREMLDDFFTDQDPDTPPPEYVTCGVSVVDQRNYTELGDVLMLGGYPSDGKTAMALMMAYHMSSSHKVGFFSLETDKRKVRDRMIASVAQIDFDAIKRRKLTEADWAALAEKSSDMSGRNITVLRASGMTAATIQSVSEAYGFDVIFIDYVQLIVPEIDKRALRSEQMADVSRSLHTFAQTTGTLVVELAQLTRQERASGWREPDMHDLKESGQFEQDADIIFLLFRPNPTDDALDQDKNRIFKIAKNKEGPRGKWPLYFDGPKQTFSVVTEVDGKTIMRQMTDAGRAAKAKNKARSYAQQTMPEFTEITDGQSAKEMDRVFPPGEEAE